MSTALAIAGVTAVLRDLLNDGLVNHNVTGTLGSSVTVSVLAPDRVVAPSGPEASQVNLFMYMVTPNTGWCNEMLPSRDGSGRQRLTNAPLALDLHYLLSVYSGGDLHAEILLGHAMQLLHERPVLTREMVKTALNPSPNVGAGLPAALRALADSGLADQAELVRITPRILNADEISKLWTATQSHFRPTAAYTASVVLIEAGQPARTPLPVLTRGKVDPLTGRDRGIELVPGLLPPVPTLTAASPPDGQPAAGIGDTVLLRGHHLDGTGHEILLTSDRFGIDMVLPALPLSPPPPAPDASADTVIAFSLAGQAAALPVGVWRVAARLLRPGDSAPRETNRVVLTLAPRMDNLPLSVARAGDASASFSIGFTPALRPGQRALLVLGTAEHEPVGAGSPATELAFVIPEAPPGRHLARLRIDGIDSPLIDHAAVPPAFLDQTVEFT